MLTYQTKIMQLLSGIPKKANPQTPFLYLLNEHLYLKYFTWFSKLPHEVGTGHCYYSYYFLRTLT